MGRDPWTCSTCGHEYAFEGIGTTNCREVPHTCWSPAARTPETDRDRLLRACLESPTDDQNRLVFADWLRENDECAFGEYLWAGVTLSRNGDDGTALRSMLDCERAALTAQAALIGWPAPCSYGWVGAGRDVRVVHFDEYTFGRRMYTRRGMVYEIGMPMSELRQTLRPALSAWPVSVITFTDVSRFQLHVNPGEPYGHDWTAATTEFRSPYAPSVTILFNGRRTEMVAAANRIASEAETGSRHATGSDF